MHFQLGFESLPEQVPAQRDDRLVGDLDADLALELLYAVWGWWRVLVRGRLRVSFHLHKCHNT